MGADQSRIMVPQMARVWLAAVGTTAPTDATTAMGTGWFDVGYFTPDSLNWGSAADFQEVRSHQANYPTRQFQTSDSANVAVDLQEWSADNFKAVYGGGTVTSPSAGVYKFVPPKVGARDEVAVCVELQDNTKKYRRIAPRAIQVEGVEQSFARTSESILPLRLSVLGSDVADPWYDLSNDPAMAPGTPTFGDVSPDTGAAAGGTLVTITGTWLGRVTGVTFDASAATGLTVLSDTTLTCITPSGTAGTADIVLTYSGGTVTGTAAFTYTA
jgi:hypothetical protein